MKNEKRDFIDRGQITYTWFERPDGTFSDGITLQSMIRSMPTVDAVSRDVHDQVRWERDVAIEQLESYGIGFGEKADVTKVVHGRWDVEVGMNYNKERICLVCNKHIESNFWNYCPNCGARMDGGNCDE